MLLSLSWIFYIFLYSINSQTVPYFDTSNSLYVGANQATLGSIDIKNFTITYPTGFTISTSKIRKPFFALSSAPHLRFQNSQAMYYWARIISYGATSMTFQLQDYILWDSSWTTVNENYGHLVSAIVKFRYLLVKSVFPSIYYSDTLGISTTPTVSAGSTYNVTYNLNTLSSPSAAPLSLGADTIFLYSITQCRLNKSASPYNSSFGLQFSLVVNTATTFTLSITSQYKSYFKTFFLNAFIYNKMQFQNLQIKFQYQIINFNNLPTGTGAKLTNSFTATFLPGTNTFFYGVAGFDFSGFDDVGFQFVINPPASGNNYVLQLNNMYTASSIPRLDLLILLVSELKCPSSQTLISLALDTCYSSCPTQTFPSTQQVGVTGIYLCKVCVPTCAQCSILATNCTSCNPTQFRSLVGTSCLPISHYYDDGVNVIAAPCDTTCKQCSGTSSFCTSCQTDSYLSSINACVACVTYDLQCFACNTTSCTSCNAGLIVQSTGGCIACVQYHAQCTGCNGTSCVTCTTGFYQSGTACSPCTSYHAECNTCSTTSCTACTVGFYVSGTGCASCQTYHTQCLECSTSACTLCGTGYQVSGIGKCVTCTDYHLECLTCSGTTCQSCATLYAVQGISCVACSSYHLQCTGCDASVCNQCNSGFYVNSGSCSSCSSSYNAQCLTCDNTQCFTCQTDYFVDPTTLKCLPLLCGDGIWVDTDQACDDGNLDNNDGCDSQCQAETDYACLLADKLPSGASLCKYTKDITVDFNNLQKDLSSNVVHLFFDLQPPTFKAWDQQMIQDLLMPVQIVDSATGAVTVIPYNSMTFSLHQNPLTNQVQITIDYGQSNLEDSYLKFNVDPSQTSDPALQDLSAQNNLYLKLNSGRNGVNLYGYSQDTYDFQGTVQSVATMVGLVSLAMVLIGLCVPAGKLIILEALAVVQIAFFSVLQFEKVPPTFAGFKNLILSNGYNKQNILSSSQTNTFSQVANILGLHISPPSNYNLSLIVLFLLPSLIGILGIIFSKICFKSSNDSKIQIKQNKINRQNIIKIIIERILFETSFYGLLICGYLAWTSVFLGIKNFVIETIIFVSVILVIWIVYLVLFVKLETQSISLKVSSGQKQSFAKPNNEKTQIFTNFSEFKFINPNQKLSNQSKFRKIYKNIYVLLSFDRILISGILIYASSLINYTSAILGVFYLTILVGLNVLHKKSQDSLLQKDRKPLFSYLYNNYALRQSINLFTIIVVQMLFTTFSILESMQGVHSVVALNQFTIKIIPISILSLLALNLLFNSFLWIWQIKQQKLIDKAKLICSIILTKTNQKGLSNIQTDLLTDKNKSFAQDQKTILQNLKKNINFNKSNSEKKKTNNQSQKLNKSQQQQQQMTNLLNSYIQTSPIFQPRNSPFIGVEEKVIRKQSIDLFKLQSGENQENLLCNESQVENVMDAWDEI